MATPGPDSTGGRAEFVQCLDAFRQELGALRQEFVRGEQSEAEEADAESFVMATKIDLLVNKLLRLRRGLASD